MAKDANSVVIPDALSNLYLAPVGTAFPADASTAPAVAWVNAGYLKDPPDQSRDITTNDVTMWNSDDPIATRVTEDVTELTIVFGQTTELTVPMYLGDGTWSVPSGVNARFIPAAGSTFPEKAVMVEITDGVKVVRFQWARMGVTKVDKLTMDKADAMTYAVTLKKLKPASGNSFVFDANYDVATA